MAWATARRVRVATGELEVDERGAGEPLVMIQTALVADELVPMAECSALRDHHRLVLYHRRGYAGSSAVEGPGSVVRDAEDCAAVMAALGIPAAHVLGLSYSGAVAMQLAAAAPERVRSLVLIEPPPVHTAGSARFRALNAGLLADRRDRGLLSALDAFMSFVVGPTWRQDAATAGPAAADELERGAQTFFDTDLPALLAWRFGPEDAGRVQAPVLHVGGSDSGPLFADVRRLVQSWFPGAEDVVVPGADHALALTHPCEVAAAVASFLARHGSGR